MDIASIVDIIADRVINYQLITPSGVAATQAANVCRSLARPYLAIANAFEKGNYERLGAEVDIGRAIWQTVSLTFSIRLFLLGAYLLFFCSNNFIQDNNTGLVLQVMGAFRRCAILKLGRTFAALTMTDVAGHISPCSASIGVIESFVSSFIMSGILDATLLHSRDQLSDTMLRFSVTVLKSCVARETYMRKQLAQEGRILNLFMDNIAESDRVLELSIEHIENLHRTQRRAEDTARGGMDMATNKATEFDLDEDMMGDLH